MNRLKPADATPPMAQMAKPSKLARGAGPASREASLPKSAVGRAIRATPARATAPAAISGSDRRSEVPRATRPKKTVPRVPTATNTVNASARVRK